MLKIVGWLFDKLQFICNPVLRWGCGQVVMYGLQCTLIFSFVINGAQQEKVGHWSFILLNFYIKKKYQTLCTFIHQNWIIVVFKQQDLISTQKMELVFSNFKFNIIIVKLPILIFFLTVKMYTYIELVKKKSEFRNIDKENL